MPRILVADDNPLSLRFFAEAIGQVGAECAFASDGRQAAVMAAAEPFDLFLFDARMPQLDGASALRRIRSGSGPERLTPALATTASSDGQLHRALRSAGFDAVLVKPTRIQTLHAVLLQHLPELRLPHDRGLWLDDPQALRTSGGDAGVVGALRVLLHQELTALPRELGEIAATEDRAALRDRLHRLAASAGFCGVPALTSAIDGVQQALDAGQDWPETAIGEFRACCAAINRLLG
ncbi:MAG TPA: response regulator [Dokdonella sp.]|uniref:response regulator n=1 Tax=Dokdonella sp. TaxID=2291710 RepID=UPI002C532A72|nr:response regulator [Dokdonella sp.]HUD43260.1 response regulator [Dokdonella sp.]